MCGDNDKMEKKTDESGKKDNDQLSTANDGLQNEIQRILGDIDGDGAISIEIAGILSKYGVKKLAVMSNWNRSALSEFAEKLPLKSIKDDAFGLKRIVFNETFASGIKGSDQSNGM